MEPEITETRLEDELASVKLHAAALSELKIKTPSSFVPESAERVQPVRIPIANAPEPTPVVPAVEYKGIKVHLKSSKPPLAFELAIESASVTVAQLKRQLISEHPDAPPVDAQRWILKGKALVDGKLLSEYSIEDGATINLMIKGAWTPQQASTDSDAAAPAPAPVHSRHSSLSARSPHTRVPSLSITSDASPSPRATRHASHASHSSISASESFVSTISSPALWKDALNLLERHFGDDENSAKKAFETWLSSSMVWISPSDKARIREETGVSAMGGF